MSEIVIQPKPAIECADCGWTDREPPRTCTVKGGVHFSNSEPERNVLERLRALDAVMGGAALRHEAGFSPNMRIRQSDVDVVADAIAEIEQLNNNYSVLLDSMYDTAKRHSELVLQLRQITEAEPVTLFWCSNHAVERGFLAPNFSEPFICPSCGEIAIKRIFYETRAVIVAPKGDKSE